MPRDIQIIVRFILEKILTSFDKCRDESIIFHEAEVSTYSDIAIPFFWNGIYVEVIRFKIGFASPKKHGVCHQHLANKFTDLKSGVFGPMIRTIGGSNGAKHKDRQHCS
ncbi:hypothetical protein E1162_09475 [Rhodobacteraceae bacterium RKSG542]|uniref:hypothetical protein n=1 Tax=Pseudovibrio flavus TaxID=2529854 RepID=UPI0012BD62C6|nr:hypothetical protein [Pseudovibrio flavus]MTI17467.1 hypothetical protein [Pseudovibrio flavus]